MIFVEVLKSLVQILISLKSVPMHGSSYELNVINSPTFVNISLKERMYMRLVISIFSSKSDF